MLILLFLKLLFFFFKNKFLGITFSILALNFMRFFFSEEIFSKLSSHINSLILNSGFPSDKIIFLKEIALFF